MENALRIRPEWQFEPVPASAGQAETGSSDRIEKVLRFATPPAADEPQAPRGAAAPQAASPVTARDFAAAIDGVHEARQALAAAEERTREAEVRTQTLAQRAAEELRSAETRIQALEARIRAAENRALEAEARATEADAWLRQIFSTISQELPVRKVGSPS